MDNSKTTKSKPLLSRALLIEAAAWVARMNGPLRTSATEQGFAQWLRDDPLHREAFTEVTRDWERIEEHKHHAHVLISAVPETAPATVEQSRFDGRWLAFAATLIIALVGAGWWHFAPAPEIATGIGEQRIMTLNDGTKVFLNTSTRMRVKYNEQRRTVQLEGGEALFEVAREVDRPFVVASGGRQVTALGTVFLVRSDVDRLAVALLEGKVSVAATPASATRGSTPTVLSPGERLTFKEDSGAPRLDRPNLSRLLAWQQGKVHFDNSPLAEAVAEMNRYNPVQLVIESEQTAAMPLSGMFAAGQSMSFARAVAETYGLTVVERDSTIVLAGVARRTQPLE